MTHVFTFGGTQAEEISDVRFGADGSVYVAGAFRGGPDMFGARVLGPCNGERRGFLLRLDATLQPEWVRCFGATSSEIVGVAFDGAGNAYVYGRFSGDFAIAGETFSEPHLTLFVASLDDAGDDRWARAYPAPAPVRADGIARHPDALFITGSFRGELQLGGQLLQGGAQYDGFLARIAPTDGEPEWALHQVEGAPGVSLFAGASPTGASPLILAGEFLAGLELVDSAGDERTVADVDGGAAHDVYVAEIDADAGTVVGPIKRIGGSADETVRGIDVGDDSGLVALTFHGTVDPDGAGPVDACTATAGDGMVVRIAAADQRPLAVRCVGGSDEQIVRAVATSRDGSLVVVGGDHGTEVDWGLGTEAASVVGETDGFVVATDDPRSVSFGAAIGGTAGHRAVTAVDAQSSGRFLYAGTFAGNVVLPDGTHTGAGQADGFVVLYEALP